MFLTLEGDTTQHESMAHTFVYMIELGIDPCIWFEDERDKKTEDKLNKAISEAVDLIMGVENSV